MAATATAKVRKKPALKTVSIEDLVLKTTPATTEEAVGVVGQLRVSFQPKNRMALILGLFLGALVPVIAFWLAHFERMSFDSPVTYVVLGGLMFSAKSVYEWGAQAFHDRFKAVGFLVLVEGTMILSHTMWLSVMCLGYLMFINAVATGTNLALRKR
jgi:hypothetical protein